MSHELGKDCAIPRVFSYPEKLLLTQTSPRKGPYSNKKCNLLSIIKLLV